MGDWAFSESSAFPQSSNQGTPPPHMQGPSARNESPPATSAGSPGSRVGFGVWTVPSCPGEHAPAMSVGPPANGQRRSGDHFRFSSESLATLTQPGNASSGWSFNPGVYAGEEGENGLRRSLSNELRSHLLTPLPPSASIESFQKRMSEVRTALEVASLAIHTSQEKNDALVETCASQQALSQSRDLQIAHLNKMIQCMSISESDARMAQGMQNSVDTVVAVYEKTCHKLAIVAFERDALKQQFDSVKCGLVKERDRASMEAGQLRVTYSAKNREVEELKKKLKEKEAREAAVEAAHENAKLKLEAEITKLNSQNEKERKAVSDLEETNKRLKSCLRAVEEEVERWRDKAERLRYELDENEIEAEIQESKIASWEASDEASILRKYQTELDIVRSNAEKKEQDMRLEVSRVQDQLREMKQLEEALKDKSIEADELRQDNEALEKVKDQLQALVNANMMREAEEEEEEPIEGYCELLGISSTSSSMVIKERRPIMKDTSSQTKRRQSKPKLEGRMKANGIVKASNELRQQSGRCLQRVGGLIKSQRKEIHQRDLEGRNWYLIAVSRDEEIQRVQRELAVCRTENRAMAEDTYRYQVESTSLQDQRLIAKLREEVLEKERELERLRLEGSGSNAEYEEKLAQMRLDMETESVANEIEARCRVAEEVNRLKAEMDAAHSMEIKSVRTAVKQEHRRELEEEIMKDLEKRERENRPVMVDVKTQTLAAPETISVAIQAWPDPTPTKNAGVQALPESTPIKHMAVQVSPEPIPFKNASVQAWPVEGYINDTGSQTCFSVLHMSVQTEADKKTDMLLESINAEIQTEIWDDGNASVVAETGIQTDFALGREGELGSADAFKSSTPAEGNVQNACTEKKRRVVDRYDYPKKGFLSCGLEYNMPTTESDIASRSPTSEGTEFEDNLAGNHAVIDGPCIDAMPFDASRDEICGESVQPSEDAGDALSLPDDIPPPGVWFGDEENSWTKARNKSNGSPSPRFETPPRQIKPYESPPTQRTEESPWPGCHQESVDATPRWKKYSNNEMEVGNKAPGNVVPLQDATSPTVNQARWNGGRDQEMPSNERVGLLTPQSQLPGAWKPRRQGNRAKQANVKNEPSILSPPRGEMKGAEQDDVEPRQPSHTLWTRNCNEAQPQHAEIRKRDSHRGKLFGNEPFELRKSYDNGNGGLDVVAAKSFRGNALKRDSQMSSFDDSSEDFEANRCGMLYGSAATEHAQNMLSGLRWSDRVSSEEEGKRDSFGQSAGMGGIRPTTPLSRSRLGTPQAETGAESPTLPEPRRNPANALDSMTAPHNAARYARERYSVSSSVKRSLAECGSRPSPLHLDTVPESSHRNGVDRFVNHSGSRYGGWTDSHELSTWNGSSNKSLPKSPERSHARNFDLGIRKMVMSSQKQFETCAVQEQACRRLRQDTCEKEERLRVSYHQTKTMLWDSKTQILRNSSLVTPRSDDLDIPWNSSVYGVPTNSSIASSNQHRNRRSGPRY
ncbi:hypothetical protein BSKO_01919 [Bryopsis sp. KO-2023]|nr:hypothetical protein BSKO_01919 [Bryopsis sp. KO-2023]